MNLRFAAVLAVFLGYGSVLAQVQFPVPRPAVKVGDKARYVQTDLWNNSVTARTESEVLELTPDGFVARSTSTANPQPAMLRWTSDFHPCRSLENSSATVCAGAFKFPMEIGTKQSYEKLPWTNGRGHMSGDCEVKGSEKITVPAGAFDAVRLECKGFWNMVTGGTASGRQTETYWYAPAVGRAVRIEYSQFEPSGRQFLKNRTELIEFVPGR